MRVLIPESKERDRGLREVCAEKGCVLPEKGPWDIVALSLPHSTLPHHGWTQWPAGQKILCGMTDDSLEAAAQVHQWQLLRVLKDESFLQTNARLTAEGALYLAMEKLDRSIRDTACLVLGFGRIGEALSMLLRGLGAAVTVAARRRESREKAGQSSVDFPEIPQVLPRMDLIFNTVPSPVLTREVLAFVKKDAWLFELASAPYGIDMDAAKALGLRCSVEGGIPGRYCPRSAAEAVYAYMERMMRKHE